MLNVVNELFKVPKRVKEELRKAFDNSLNKPSGKGNYYAGNLVKEV